MKNIVSWLIAPCSIVVISLSASAQSPPSNSPGTSSHPVQLAPVDKNSNPTTFDVVSIRPTQIAADGASIESPPNGDGITMRNITVHEMIDYAYSFRHPELVSGLPEWAKTKNYDLVAKVADANLASFRKSNPQQRRQMLQAVLAERFQLKVHREPKEVPIYALVVEKKGTKMKEATPGDHYADGPKSPDGTPAGAGTLIPTAKGLTGQAAEMTTLALMLSTLDLGREVVDRTGLTGRYDFTLRCAPTQAMRPLINGQMQPVSEEDATLPSIFTAVQEQLGLKLESTKGMIEGLVIDHIEQPSEN
jgi:uncharacterized protein (TIGR03435 family)